MGGKSRFFFFFEILDREKTFWEFCSGIFWEIGRPGKADFWGILDQEKGDFFGKFGMRKSSFAVKFPAWIWRFLAGSDPLFWVDLEAPGLVWRFQVMFGCSLVNLEVPGWI